ncbi:MAG: VTT domain-containing protein [Clostridia bacterium]|nr:VTT domain-containing protein [Clostridia bacterium]
MKNETKKSIKVILRLLLLALICVVLVVGLGHVLTYFGLDQLSEEQIQDMISAYGAWGPIVFILFTFLQVTFIPIPFVVSILAGNLLFGFWGSFFYSLIGTVLGSVFAFILGRKIGRPFVNWAFGDAEAVDKYLKQAHGKEFVVFFFMFLLPFFPDDALCALAGLTNLNNRQFGFILAISRPITILGNLILWTGEVIPYNGWGLVLIIAAVILTVVSFLLSMKYSDKINEIFTRMTDALAQKISTVAKTLKEYIKTKRQKKVKENKEEQENGEQL